MSDDFRDYVDNLGSRLYKPIHCIQCILFIPLVSLASVSGFRESDGEKNKIAMAYVVNICHIYYDMMTLNGKCSVFRIKS